jgi:hypothetical protein
MTVTRGSSSTLEDEEEDTIKILIKFYIYNQLDERCAFFSLCWADINISHSGRGDIVIQTKTKKVQECGQSEN